MRSKYYSKAERLKLSRLMTIIDVHNLRDTKMGLFFVRDSYDGFAIFCSLRRFSEIERLKHQNRPEDVAWAKGKTEWLWNQLREEHPPLQVYLQSPKIDEYIDHGDYM